MKERPSMRSPLESMTTMTAGIDEVNLRVQQIATKTQQEYFAQLRIKHRSSPNDHFSSSEFYLLLAEKLPRYVPEKINREAFEKFKTRDPGYENLFILLNLRTIITAAGKYFTNVPEHDDDLIQGVIEKLNEPLFSPPSGNKLRPTIHAYASLIAKKIIKKDIAERIEEKEFIPDSTVIPLTEQVVEQKVEEEMLCTQLENAVSDLKPRQRTILELKYGEGKTLEEIGKSMKISRERVRVILVRTLAGMRYKNVLERYPLIKEYRDKAKRRKFC